MSIWRITEDPNNYRSLTTPDLSSDERLDTAALFRSGSALGASWKPVGVELWGNGEEEQKPIGDFPDVSSLAPLPISARALEVLYPLIKDNVEVLDFIVEGPIGKFYALNIFFADCLDHAKSELVRFPSTGRIMDVDEFAFRPGCLDGIHLFRLPELWTYVFADDTFKQAVEKNGLVGLVFYAVPEVGSAK